MKWGKEARRPRCVWSTGDGTTELKGLSRWSGAKLSQGIGLERDEEEVKIYSWLT